MATNPYQGQPASAFWKTGVVQADPHACEDIYSGAFELHPGARIATAGSCSAQHISQHLRLQGFNFLDVEPPPPGLPEVLHRAFGFSMYSARYGNIYTVLQVLQLVCEAGGLWTPAQLVWQKDGCFFDALRPALEPEGLDPRQEVLEHLRHDICRVRHLFEVMDVFVCTLGLAEMWVHRESGTVYPAAPGAIAGTFDAHLYGFENACFADLISDFMAVLDTLALIREGLACQILLTVSPVPLVATASAQHVLAANIYSTATLRAVAGQMVMTHARILYFPAYELVTNSRLREGSFAENLRSVHPEAVANVMAHFLRAHPRPELAEPQPQPLLAADPGRRSQAGGQELEQAQCEEALLDAFSP